MTRTHEILYRKQKIITTKMDARVQADHAKRTVRAKPSKRGTYSEHQHANSAYDLVRHLMAVKQCLLTQPPEVSLATATLDEACDALFPFSEFHKAGYDLIA
jgi:hypothetical protein